MAKRATLDVKIARGFRTVERVKTPRWLAYRGKSSEVRVRRADGSEEKQLFESKGGGLNCPLAWSPDGGTLFHGHDQIHAIDVSTGRSRPVTSFPPGEDFSVLWFLRCSADGKFLVFLRRKGSVRPLSNPPPGMQLCRIGTDGRDLRVLLDDPDLGGMPVLDWDGCQRNLVLSNLIPSSGTGFWSVDVETGRQSQLATVPGRYFLRASRSPDGQQLAYAGHGHGPSPAGIYLLDASGARPRRICPFGRLPVWSPGGDSIAFMDDCHALWRIDLQDLSRRRLVEIRGRRFSLSGRLVDDPVPPVWSREGQFLCFRATKWRRLRKSRFPLCTRGGPIGGSRDGPRFDLWDSAARVGIVDFEEREIWLGDERWHHVAWSPA